MTIEDLYMKMVAAGKEPNQVWLHSTTIENMADDIRTDETGHQWMFVLDRELAVVSSDVVDPDRFILWERGETQMSGRVGRL